MGKIIKKDDFSTKHTDYFCDIRSLVSGYNYYFYCLSIKMVVFLIEIELIPFFFCIFVPKLCFYDWARNSKKTYRT